MSKTDNQMTLKKKKKKTDFTTTYINKIEINL